MTIHLKRVYDPPARNDGLRILVDRIWPRGVTKDRAKVDLWLKEVAPSTPLRRWFGHDPARWSEFRNRYRSELADHEEALEELRRCARTRSVTLLFSARDEQHNNAVALKEFLDPRH
jgi:uncharacterized protein YeaO (DUF488 family)